MRDATCVWWARLLGLAATAALGGAAAPAWAQCPTATGLSLTDSGGFAWNFDSNGAVVDGTSNAFDGLYTLTIDGIAFVPPGAPGTELAGRQIVFGPVMLVTLGLAVRRRVLVPTGEAWARWIDEIANARPSATTVTFELRTNSGADSMFEVVTTSDGDATLETSDLTFVLDNELTMPPPPEMPMETPPPASCHVLGGVGASVLPSSITSGASFTCVGNEGATVRFSLTVPPLSVVRLMYFAAQSDTRAGASAMCGSLAALPASAFSDLSGMTRSEIVNWPIALPTGSACSSDIGCTSGHCVDGVCCDSACGGGALGDCEACAGSAGSTAADGTCGVVGSTHTCRPESSVCDRLERCDGTSRVCTADLVRPAGTMCRPAATRSCDVAESCDGVSALCPTDRFLAAGMVCDTLGTIPCWTGGVCTGTNPGCPIARFLPDRTPCDDTAACTEAWCMMGACLSAGAACDDQDTCTTDTCPDSVTCAHAPMTGCDGGVPPVPDAGPPEFEDTGPIPGEDGATVDLDAGASGDDAGTDLDGSAGRMDARVRRDGDPLTTADLSVGGGGCACRAGRGSELGVGALTATIALCAARRRRRR